MANEIHNPGFEDITALYTGSVPLPTSIGGWTAWRTTASRQNSIVASGGWAAEVACPVGGSVATIFYQDFVAETNPYSFVFSFSVYIADDSEEHEVALMDGYDHDSAAHNNLVRLGFTTASTIFTVGEIPHTYAGLSGGAWHTVLVESNVGMTEMDLTIDGVFRGSEIGTAPDSNDILTIGCGHFAGASAATSTFYFDNFRFERFVDVEGLPGSPFIQLEYAVPV